MGLLAWPGGQLSPQSEQTKYYTHNSQSVEAVREATMFLWTAELDPLKLIWIKFTV